MDQVMTGVAVLTVILVLTPLVAIFGYLALQGRGLDQLGVPDADAEA